MIFQSANFVRSRPGVTICAAVSFLFIVWFLYPSAATPLDLQPAGALHLLIPATSSNTDLCKLLLSASILHYPVPALINWGAHEAENAYVQHLAKVETILSYLHKLENTTSPDDLILILDGYDIWLQLHSEILVKRYFSIMEATDARSTELYGESARHTILFGPDKICWPIDFSRPACWAVPELPLQEHAWGPPSKTDEHNMPRWLNSGTILGPLRDMTDMFQATLDLIHNNHTTDSDQFYFANVWGDQEYARLSGDPVRLEAKKTVIDAAEHWGNYSEQPPRANASLVAGQRTDYYVTLDYLSELFQTLAFYKQFLTFMRADQSWFAEKAYKGSSRYRFDLPQDIMDSPPPYADLENYKAAEKPVSELLRRTWENLELCMNVITQQVPVSLHFTGEKGLRQIWWEKIWFQRDGKLLRGAALSVPDRPINGGKPINGRVWSNGAPPGAENVTMGGREGAMSDDRKFINWDELCGAHERELYAVHGTK